MFGKVLRYVSCVLLFIMVSACASTIPTSTLSPTASVPPPLATSLHIIDPLTPQSPKILAEIWGLGMPVEVAFGFSSVWVPSHRDPNATARIDPVSNQVIATVQETPFRANSVVVTDDSVWVGGANNIVLIDPKTNTIIKKLTENPCDLYYGFNSVWQVGGLGEPIKRFDPKTGDSIVSIQLPGVDIDSSVCMDIRLTNSAVWVITNSELIKIDPSSNKISLRKTLADALAEAKAQTTLPAGDTIDFVWIPVTDGLLRVDPNSGIGLTFLPLSAEQGGSHSFAITKDAVWLAGFGEIIRVNAITNKIDATYKAHDKGNASIGIGFDSIWIAYDATGLAQRLDIAP